MNFIISAVTDVGIQKQTNQLLFVSEIQWNSRELRLQILKHSLTNSLHSNLYKEENSI